MVFYRDVSNFIKTMTEQMTMDVGGSSSNESSNSTSLFSTNMSTNGRLAFAAFQRVVCGRNMSSDQLFSDGGLPTR